MSPVLLSLLAFIGASGVLTITPGVDTALVLRSAASGGPRTGLAAAVGICGGLLVWGAGAAFGITALLAASEAAFTVLKFLGAAYLVYLGAKLLVDPRTALEAPAGSPASAPGGGARAALRRGFYSNILNPKVGVFYITFLPQFIPHGASVALFSLLLAGIHGVLAMAWLSLLTALTVPLGRFLARSAVIGALDRITGCVFLAFGARLALAQSRA